VDIILGADKLFQVFKRDRIKVHADLIAQSTTFGWIIVGQLANNSCKDSSTNPSICSLHSDIDIYRSLKRFWQIEEPATPKSMLTADETKAEQIFRKTTTRTKEGRYIVQLPFKTPSVLLGNSYTAAVTRLRAMERRFQKKPHLKSEYIKFMDEYQKLGHMEQIQQNEICTRDCYYLPHHAVFKTNNTTGKLRVVFDGSTKTSSTFSLNDALLIGPPIQRDLFSVCARFRLHPFTFTADLEKMFRQIWVYEPHQEFQRILWRTSPASPINYYRLKTVTYSTSPAPFLAVRVLEQLAKDQLHTHPTASKVLLNNCYVDDTNFTAVRSWI